MFPVKRLLREALSPRRVALIALGMAITTFGLFNIHRRVDVTEGGVLGMPRLRPAGFWPYRSFEPSTRPSRYFQ